MGPLTRVLKLIGLLGWDTKLFFSPSHIKHGESREGNVISGVEVGLSNSFEVGGHFTTLPVY